MIKIRLFENNYKVETDYGFVYLEIDDQFKVDEFGDYILDSDNEPINEKYVRLDYVEIYKQFRRQGHAKELVLKAVNKAKEFNLPIYLVAHEYDKKVIGLNDLVNFYKKCGFVIVQDLGNIIMKLKEKK